MPFPFIIIAELIPRDFLFQEETIVPLIIEERANGDRDAVKKE
jgi:hypothetical protein